MSKPLPFGGPELLEQARDLCKSLSALPAGLDQTKLISLVSDATFGLQQLQKHGQHFWPRPHEQTSSMDFGGALKFLKAGQRVARAGWNGKGMWIALSPGSSALPAERFWAPQNRKHAEEHGPTDVLPCITMKTADGSILMGWLASQTDMLADDWCLV